MLRRIGIFITSKPKVATISTVCLISGTFGYQKIVKFENDIIIKDKYVKHEGDETMYMITDTNNRIYKFDNSVWRLHWKRAELWNNVDKGKTYKIKGIGIRSPLFGWYPRVFSVKELH